MVKKRMQNGDTESYTAGAAVTEGVRTACVTGAATGVQATPNATARALRSMRDYSTT